MINIVQLYFDVLNTDVSSNFIFNNATDVLPFWLTEKLFLKLMYNVRIVLKYRLVKSPKNYVIL